MNWSMYYYLAIAVLVAAVLFGLLIWQTPKLSQPSKKRTPTELLFICAISAAALFTIYANFYFEHLSFAYAIGDVGSDTIEQYVPFYLNLIGNVRDGSFTFVNFWSFEYELGVNATTYQSWLYDPFNLIVVPLGLLLGEAHLSLILVIAQSVKVVLSALLFDHFLTRFCETPIARILGSLLYALSGFMILYGQHYWLGSVFPVFTLCMLAFELYLEKKSVPRFLVVTIVVGLLLMWSPYIAFMVLLFAALYLLLRIPCYMQTCSIRTYFATIGRMAVPVVSGILLSGVVFIPYALFLLTETSRTSGSMSLAEHIVLSLTSFINLDWIPAILSRTLGSGLINTGAETVTTIVSPSFDMDFTGSFPYEFILLGYSAGAFVLLSQFFSWAYAEGSKKAKLLISLATVLIALYCFHQFLPTVFTAMVRLQYRSCFIIALPACTAIALGFEKRILPGKIAKVPFALAAVLTLAVLVWSLFNTMNGRLVCFFYLVAFSAMIACVILLAKQKKLAPSVLTALFIALVLSTSIVDGFFTNNSRKTVATSDFPLSFASENGKDTIAALDYLEEHDDSFYRIDSTYSIWVPLNDSLILHYPSASAYNSSPDSDVDEFYRKLWKEAISTWAVYSQGFKNNPDQPAVLDLLNVKYVLSLEPLAYDWCELEHQEGAVYIYRNTGAESILTVRGNAVAESEADALESAEARRTLLATSVIVPDEEMDALRTSLSTAQPDALAASSEFYEVSNGEMSGTVTLDSDGIACLAIPNTGTWHISIDGKTVDTFRADYGFIGFELSAGTHTITATYTLAGTDAGLALTGAGLALSIIACIVISHQNRTKQLGSHSQITA